MGEFKIKNVEIEPTKKFRRRKIYSVEEFISVSPSGMAMKTIVTRYKNIIDISYTTK